MRPKKIALMASGKGSNAINILNYAQERPDLFEVVALICDQPQALVLDRALDFDCPFYLIPLPQAKNKKVAKEQHEQAFLQVLQKHQAEWVALAGFMRILSAQFIAHFYDEKLKLHRLLNIHPSMLPAFKGKDAYGQAYKAQVQSSGVTLHFVDSGVDTGPIFLQQSFNRDESDSLEDFIKKGQEIEYRLYRQGLEKVALDEINLDFSIQEHKNHLQKSEALL